MSKEMDRMAWLLELELYGTASEHEIAELAVLRHRMKRRGLGRGNTVESDKANGTP